MTGLAKAAVFSFLRSNPRVPCLRMNPPVAFVSFHRLKGFSIGA